MDSFLEKLSNPVYKDTVQFLFNLRYSGIKLGLQNITLFLKELGNPHLNKKYIHIAGTNGKGSTVAILEALLMESGYTVGVFTSPHLITFQERIRINQKMIPVEAIIQFVEQYRDKIKKYKLTFFETSTALAFWYFSQQNPDIILIEAGLGGRLDSTNVIHAPIVGITHIDYDHTQYLGDTIEKIASEKAGIIHKNSNVFLSQNSDEVVHIFQERCIQTNAYLYYTPNISSIQLKQMNPDKMIFDFFLHTQNKDFSFAYLKSKLIGIHQLENLRLALTILLQSELIPPESQPIQRGLDRVIWPARLQVIAHNPVTILDVGHNPDGFEQTLYSIRKLIHETRLFVIAGIVNDKEPRRIASILEQYAYQILLVSFASSRTLAPEKFYQFFEDKSKVICSKKNVYETFLELKSKIKKDDTILIIGSHYLIGEFLESWLHNKKRFDFYYKIP